MRVEDLTPSAASSAGLAIVLLLLLYNDDLDEQIGDLGVLLSEMDPTSAYEVAWNVAHVPGGLDARVPIVGT